MLGIVEIVAAFVETLAVESWVVESFVSEPSAAVERILAAVVFLAALYAEIAAADLGLFVVVGIVAGLVAFVEQVVESSVAGSFGSESLVVELFLAVLAFPAVLYAEIVVGSVVAGVSFELLLRTLAECLALGSFELVLLAFQSVSSAAGLFERTLSVRRMACRCIRKHHSLLESLNIRVGRKAPFGKLIIIKKSVR